MRTARKLRDLQQESQEIVRQTIDRQHARAEREARSEIVQLFEWLRVRYGGDPRMFYEDTSR